MPRESTRGRKQRRGKPFCKGYDPRRHIFTPEECSRGGYTTARRYTCVGRWWPDWHERCSRKVRDSKGGFHEPEEVKAAECIRSDDNGGDERVIPFRNRRPRGT